MTLPVLLTRKTLSRNIRKLLEQGGRSVPVSGTRWCRCELVHVDQSAQIGGGDDADHPARVDDKSAVTGRRSQTLQQCGERFVRCRGGHPG